jgi:ElaA protein
VNIEVCTARFEELDPFTLYEVLRLRAEVFVLEQECAFLDLDGRDTEPSTLHLWLEDDGAIVAYARLLFGDGITEIGRIVTPLDRRRTGVGAQVLREAISRAEGVIHLKAQARLAGWYEQFGFEIAGPCFLEDGIAHVPMRRER